MAGAVNYAVILRTQPGRALAQATHVVASPSADRSCLRERSYCLRDIRLISQGLMDLFAA